jgi:DNA-binding helix-hairpin-helix protein with protein kinase domain
MTRLLRASNNASVGLGRELGRGGEGAVYPVLAAPDLVAKIYLKPPTQLKIEKLRSMARRASPALLRVAAWPVDVLADEAGNVRGFLMPKVSAREDVHQLYSPKSRRRAFPGVDFRFLVRVATNIARAFAQVHAFGHVVGDVNHGNALVGRDGTVVLIDCDSFQIRDGARHFTCDVGVPLFTAPELAGQPFRGLKRTANHDGFGLAVLVFHLLFLGRHPFAGRYSDGEMPIERAIAESRFVYGANAAASGMSPPPGTLRLASFGERIAQLFERAFAAPSEAARPTASQWIEALQALEAELVPCADSPAHFHRRDHGGDGGGGGGAGCCWCEVERQIGVRLFGKQIKDAATLAAAHLAQVWDAITSIQKPMPLAPLEALEEITELDTESHDPLGYLPRQVLSILLVGFGVGCLALEPGNFMFGLLSIAGGLAMGFTQWFGKKEKEGTREIDAAVASARKQLAVAIRRWNSVCHDERFDKLLTDLTGAKRKLLELPRQRDERVKNVRDHQMKRQRDDYLDTFRIDQAKFKKLWPQEITLLASYGIETAEDALRLAPTMDELVVEGTRDEILAWAQRCAAGFRFDPSKEVDLENMTELEATYQAQHDQLLAVLKAGQDDLKQLADSIAAQRSLAETELENARRALTEAQRQLS